MQKWLDTLIPLALVAWVGSLWAIGYLAVPVLFQAQPNRLLAGVLAGEMFAAVGYIGMVCGSFLLLQCGRVACHRCLFGVLVVMLMMTLLLQFGIQPLMADMKLQALPLEVMHSPLADRFKMWHGISSVLYLIQSLLGGYVVVRYFSLRA